VLAEKLSRKLTKGGMYIYCEIYKMRFLFDKKKIIAVAVKQQIIDNSMSYRKSVVNAVPFYS
jgi:hypothetical protein